MGRTDGAGVAVAGVGRVRRVAAAAPGEVAAGVDAETPGAEPAEGAAVPAPLDAVLEERVGAGAQTPLRVGAARVARVAAAAQAADEPPPLAGDGPPPSAGPGRRTPHAGRDVAGPAAEAPVAAGAAVGGDTAPPPAAASVRGPLGHVGGASEGIATRPVGAGRAAAVRGTRCKRARPAGAAKSKAARTAARLVACDVVVEGVAAETPLPLRARDGAGPTGAHVMPERPRAAGAGMAAL